MAFKCSSKKFGLLALLSKVLVHILIKKVIRFSTALCNTCCALHKDPSFVCLALLRQYVKLMTCSVYIPFAHYYESISKEGIPMLRPSVGRRRSFTMLIHFIAVCRACWWIQILFRKDLKVLHNGGLTSDFCLVAGNSFTAVAMIVAWIKTWVHTARIAWLHSSLHRINRNLSS